MTSMDVDEKPKGVEGAPVPTENENVPKDPKELEKILLEDISQQGRLIQKGCSEGESRFVTRALRSLTSIRKSLSADILKKLFQNLEVSSDHELFRIMSEALNGDSGSMEMEDKSVAPSESDAYIGLLCLIHLVDLKKLPEAQKLSTYLHNWVKQCSYRSADPLLAKIHYYYAYVHELLGQGNAIRLNLLNSMRTATLRRDGECQAALTNCLLRSYIQSNQIDQADKLTTKSTFPESASTHQHARYLFYLGKIKAILLDYTESHKHLLQAIRKAPQGNHAIGFQQAVHKYAVIVQLLTGEIPERSLFRQPILKKSLLPYYHITHAVRVGDLLKFRETMNRFAKEFVKDGTFTLILRLRHNVIKTGIRMINLSYIKISLRDICEKLHLESQEETEYIVAKAIRDGVIDAVIKHDEGYLQSKETKDIYSTWEPQHAFHQRIGFCLNLHNDSIKALRFPEKREVPAEFFRKEDHDPEEELAREMAIADDDF